jgi:hypothetical protein
MSMIRYKAIPLDTSKVDELTEDLVKETKCPYSRIISYLNKANSYLTPDRSRIFHTIVNNLTSNLAIDNRSKYIDDTINQQDLNVKNAIKTRTHIYQTLYIQNEIYELLQQCFVVTKTSPLSMLKGLADHSDLTNIYQRKNRWGGFVSTLQQLIDPTLQKRDSNKMFDREMMVVENFASHHSRLTKWCDFDFVTLIEQGINDAVISARHILDTMPELYKEKFWKLPSREEYRAIVEKNMKHIMPQASTLNLGFLVGVLRDGSLAHLSDYTMNYALGITIEDFELDDAWLATVKKPYIQKVVQRLKDKIAERIANVQQYGNHYSLEQQVRLGCPAMKAKTKDGKRITDQFIDDMLTLLDEVYFPYRDK